MVRIVSTTVRLTYWAMFLGRLTCLGTFVYGFRNGMRLADRLREELGPEFIVEAKVRAFVKSWAT